MLLGRIGEGMNIKIRGWDKNIGGSRSFFFFIVGGDMENRL